MAEKRRGRSEVAAAACDWMRAVERGENRLTVRIEKAAATVTATTTAALPTPPALSACALAFVFPPTPDMRALLAIAAGRRDLAPARWASTSDANARRRLRAVAAFVLAVDTRKRPTNLQWRTPLNVASDPRSVAAAQLDTPLAPGTSDQRAVRELLYDLMMDAAASALPAPTQTQTQPLDATTDTARRLAAAPHALWRRYDALAERLDGRHRRIAEARRQFEASFCQSARSGNASARRHTSIGDVAASLGVSIDEARRAIAFCRASVMYENAVPFVERALLRTASSAAGVYESGTDVAPRSDDDEDEDMSTADEFPGCGGNDSDSDSYSDDDDDDAIAMLPFSASSARTAVRQQSSKRARPSGRSALSARAAKRVSIGIGVAARHGASADELQRALDDDADSEWGR